MDLRTLTNRPEIKTIGIPLGAFFAGIVLLLFLAIPGFNRVLELQNEITAEQDRLTKMVEKTRKLSDLASQGDVLAKEFELFNRAVPTDSAVPELLNQIQSLSNSTGEKIVALQFSGVENGTGTVREVRLRYASEGSFSNLQRLVEAFEDASRLIDLSSLRFNQRFDDATKTPFYSPEMSLVSFYTQEPVLRPDNPLTF